MTTSLTQYFSSTDYLLALPMLLLTLFALGILMIDLLLPKQWKQVNAYTALAGLAFSAAAVGKLHYAYHLAQSKGLSFVDTGFMGSLLVDPFALYFFYLFLAGGAIAVLMSIRYLEIEHENHGEFYALLLFSIVGMMCMAAGYDIVLIFIGLELMAISTYVLVGFLRRDKRSNEAALKYLLLGAFSSGIFAYGLSLFYGLTGSTNLAGIAQGLQQILVTRPNDPIVIFALLATTTGLLFKIAAVPFHQWAPDAYEGAPTSVTGFMSVAVKSAGWAMLLRIFLFGLVSVALAVRPHADLCCHRHHDRRQPGGHDADQPEAAAGLLVDRACRLYVAGPDRQRWPDELYRHHGDPDLPAGVHLHEPGRVCGNHFAAPP